VVARVDVLGGMPVGRVVAAADVPARQADAQMQPAPALAQAVLAAGDLRRELLQLDLIEMSATAFIG